MEIPPSTIFQTVLSFSRVKTYHVFLLSLDSTNEYVCGKDGEASTNGLYTHGLQCVTVLIGVFDHGTGLPLLGVTAQPFWQNVADGKGRWMGRVACGVSTAGKTAVHISPSNER